MFSSAYVKFSLGSLDDPKLAVDAQYNPKELQFDRTVTWGEQHAVADQRSVKPGQEYAGAPAETVKVELLFDGFENDGNLHSHLAAMGTVESNIQKLREMSTPTFPAGKKRVRDRSRARLDDGEHKRPHYCVAWWGEGQKMMPRFECVIESLSVKYTAFGRDGAVLRATVIVGLKSADRLKDPDMRVDDFDIRRKRAEIRAEMRKDADEERAAQSSQNWNERNLEWRKYDSKLGDWRFKSENEKK